MLGIIILNYNTYLCTQKCIESIIENTHSKYKIYVIDNSSPDGSGGKLCDEYKEKKNIRVITNSKNVGFSRANNIGIQIAIADGCDYILISNPDVIYTDYAIDIILEDIRVNEQIGIIGPSCLDSDHNESQLLRRTYDMKIYMMNKKPFRYIFRKFKNMCSELPYPSENQEMPFLFHGMVRGCCFLIKSDLFQQIGLFDESLFLYCEEWFLAKKIQDLGLWCAFEKKSVVYHEQAQATNQRGNAFKSFHMYLSAFCYMKKCLKVSKINQFILLTQNVINYLIKALIYREYRKLLLPFVVSSWQLFIYDEAFIAEMGCDNSCL